MKPVRIQRKRTAGYDMQAVSRAVKGLDCISVTQPGRWGNPYDVKLFGRALSLVLFRNSLNGVWSPDPVKSVSDELCDVAYAAHHAFMKRFYGNHPLSAARSELRGHNLACYCQISDACHADIYLDILYGGSGA
jgi:hypothetical protein